jgi:hypothetical protein
LTLCLSQVRLTGLGADAMDELAHLELRVAKEIAVFLADQQTCQGQQFLVGLATQASYQFLRFPFEIRSERLLERHDGLLGRGR